MSKKKSEPDWDALKEIALKMKKAIKAKKWNEASFKLLLAEAKEASRGDDELIEFLYNEADDDW